MGLATGRSTHGLTEVSDADYRMVFGPRTPSVTAINEEGGRLRLGIDIAGENPNDVRLRVYRDGIVIADDLPGSTFSFVDNDVDVGSQRSPCYTVESTFAVSNNHSQHAAANCFWGPAFERIVTIDAADLEHVGGEGSFDHGRFHYEPWGRSGDRLTIPIFVAQQSGTHLVQATFGNGAGDVTSGITCGVKKVVVTDVGSNVVVGSGAMVMPHMGTWDRFEDSSFVAATLEAGRSYRIDLLSDDDTINMSSLAHFQSFTGGLGGGDQPFNELNIADIKVLAR